MFKVFWNNLSKMQKIGLVVLAQGLVVIVLVLLVQSFAAEKSHVEIESGSVSENGIPKNAEDFISENIWMIIKSRVADVTRNDIDDVVIREGTYTETVNEDGSIAASFIVDIDSLKQTFTVSTGWSKNGNEVYETIVDCPPLNLMKYPETVCYGAYHDTYSLDLYLPYTIMASHNDEAVDVYIEGNEEEKEILISVANCNPGKLKNQAMEYLKSTPIDLSKYRITYDVYELEYPYFDEEKMTAEEINELEARCNSE